MASNGGKQPFLPGLADQTNNKPYGTDRKGFLSVRTSSLANLISKDFGSNIISLTHPGFIFGKPHTSFWNLTMALAVYLGIGTLLFYAAIDDIKGKKQTPIIDALYFTVTTMTTVGYGDLLPATTYVKMLCCVFVVIGMTLAGLIMSSAADYIVAKQEMKLVKALSNRQKYGPSKIMETGIKKISSKFLLVFYALSILMMIGIIVLYSVEGLEFIDAVYCVCTTITTLGYGDKAFSTNSGRLFAIIWILTSTFGLGQLFMYLADEFTDCRQSALVNWVLSRRVTNLNPHSVDMDNDGVAEVAEFAVYKLKEKGKISQEDISSLMKEFEDLDVQKCGFLSASDLVFGQSKRLI